MKLWKVFVTCILSLALVVAASAQDKPKPDLINTHVGPLSGSETQGPVPLTEKEKLSIRSAQVKRLELIEQRRELDERTAAQVQKADADLEQKIADATRATQQTVDAVFAARKITTADATLCEDAVPNSPCADAPAGDLTLQPTKKEAKK